MRLISKADLNTELGISPATAKVYRLRGDWIEGFHWVRVGTKDCWRSADGKAPTKVLYVLENCRDYLLTRHCPEQHEARIREYEASLMGGGVA